MASRYIKIFIIFYQNKLIKNSCHRIQISDLWVNEFKYGVENIKFKMAIPIWQLLTLKFIIFCKIVLKQGSFHYEI